MGRACHVQRVGRSCLLRGCDWEGKTVVAENPRGIGMDLGLVERTLSGVSLI